MLKSLGIILLVAIVLLVLGVTGVLFRVWPISVGDHNLQIDAAVISRLQELRDERKFVAHPPSFYPGAPSEAIRITAQSSIDATIDQLIVSLPVKPQRSTVLAAFKASLPAFDHFDTEERDRALLYLEQIMEITNVRSSGQLLNVWRYGFPLGWVSGA